MLKNRKLKLRLILPALLSGSLFAQQIGNMPQINGSVQGRVLDDLTNNGVGYANVMIFRLADSLLVDGAMSDENGYFYVSPVSPGNFYANVKFIGYHSYDTEPFRVTPNNTSINLPDIRIKRAAIQLSEVQVVGERPVIEFKADKRVIHADQFAASLSGTAVEILENVPSMDVDIEGNVTLRGSSNFLVLIDGHPSVFEGSDALEQVPATIIQSIEIITNPSARYDPDGTTGIINIITKKQKITGVSGQVSINAGTGDKYATNIALSVRRDKFTWNNTISWRDYQSGGERTTNNETTLNDSLFILQGKGKDENQRQSWSVRTGLDYRPTEKLNLSLQFRTGHWGRSRISNQTYYELPVSAIYSSYDENSRGSDFWSINFDFTQKFRKENHELSGSVQFRNRDSEEFNEMSRTDENNDLTDRIKNTEDGDDKDWRLKLDYVNPITENRRIEAGIQSRLSFERDITGKYEWDHVNDEYANLSQFSQDNDYEHVIHSIYTIYKDRLGLMEWQLGGRGEYTYRNMKLHNQDTTYNLDRWDFFPSFHMSVPISENNQVMGSYTRRIERPRNWYLEPYQTQRDVYSVYQGNPGLKPEYINALEASWQLSRRRDYLTADIYHRTTENKIERVQSPIDQQTMLYTFSNVGKDYSTGSEIAINYSPYKFWTLFLSGDIYRYRVEGSYNGRNFDNSSNNWGVKFNNTFFVGTKTRLQFDSSFRGPSVTSQGRREAFWVSNASVKHDFNRNWTATLQVRDVFSSGQYEFTSTGPGFENNSRSKRESPITVLSVSYRFSNYKNGDRQRRQGEEENGESGNDRDDIFMF